MGLTLGPVAYDCVKIIVVRDGSAFLFSEFGQQAVMPGDVILLGANVLCGSEPEGHITVTTIYLDTDYVLDQVRWQYAGFLDDRLDAQGFADRLYTEPMQILHLGEDRAGMLMPWLDELVALSVDGDFVTHYLRMQALWFQIAYVIAPFIKVSPVRISPSQRAHIRPTLPRDRRFAPFRPVAHRGPPSCRLAAGAPRTKLDAGGPRRRGAPVPVPAEQRVRRRLREDPVRVPHDAPGGATGAPFARDRPHGDSRDGARRLAVPVPRDSPVPPVRRRHPRRLPPHTHAISLRPPRRQPIKSFV